MAAVTRNSPVAAAAQAVTTTQLFDQCVEVDRQLRAALRKKSFYDAEVRQLKQQLKEQYERLLFTDYEYAQSLDVEQMLWKSVFYGTIEGFRQRMQSATKAGDAGRDALKKVSAAYLKFLEDARRFYKQLLVKLQKVYGDVGAVVELEASPEGASDGAPPSPASLLELHYGSPGLRDCRVSAHRCLIYLGDISRYQAQLLRGSRSAWQVASGYYQQAGRVHPRSGNPFNQLGVIAFYLKDELRAVYYYFRSLSVVTPFVTARENLKLLFEKNRTRFAQLSSRQDTQQPSQQAAQTNAKQALSQLSADLSTAFVRMSAILFDHINSEQFQDALDLGFRLLGQLLHQEAAMDLLASAPPADNLLVHLMVLSVFSVYSTEGHVAKGTAGGGVASSDLLQLHRYHHLATAVMFRFAAQLVEAAAARVGQSRPHAPLEAAAFLVLNWVLAQPQLVMLPRNRHPHKDEMSAQASFWKALCQLVHAYGEAARREQYSFQQKAPGILPEELEFRGFEPFRVTAADLALDAHPLQNAPEVRRIRTIQSCRSVSDMMHHHLNASPNAALLAAAQAADPALASPADLASCNVAVRMFCGMVQLLYDGQPLVTPEELLQPAGGTAQPAANGAAPGPGPGAPTSAAGSSPRQEFTSAPMSGSSGFQTVSSTGGVAPGALLDLPPAHTTPPVRAHLPAPAATALDQAAGLAARAAADAAAQHMEEEAEEEEEEVIVFRPQNISRPPSRAPDGSTGAAGTNSLHSRTGSATSCPVSPTVTAAGQEFNLFANDSSLAFHRLLASGGAQLEQQLSLDSLRSEVSTGQAQTPKLHRPSPDASGKMPPAAGSLPEPPAEWTKLQQAGSGGLPRPAAKQPLSARSSPVASSLPQPAAMPPHPPPSLQVAAVSGTAATATAAAAAATTNTGGYGFGAIGPQRSSPVAAAAPTPLPGPAPGTALGRSLLAHLQEAEHLAPHTGGSSHTTPTAAGTPAHQSPTLYPSSQQSPNFPTPPSQSVLVPLPEPLQPHGLASVLQQLQRQPAQGQSPRQSLSQASSGSLPLPPASPALHDLTASPTQLQLPASAVPMPSRLSLSSTEPLLPPAPLPPAPRLLGATSWAGASAPAPPPAPSLAGVGPMLPLPGFGDVLTLAQLEQAQLAANDESFANDQAEATAMAAAGQLLDDQPLLPLHQPPPQLDPALVHALVPELRSLSPGLASHSVHVPGDPYAIAVASVVPPAVPAAGPAVLQPQPPPMPTQLSAVNALPLAAPAAAPAVQLAMHAHPTHLYAAPGVPDAGMATVAAQPPQHTGLGLSNGLASTSMAAPLQDSLHATMLPGAGAVGSLAAGQQLPREAALAGFSFLDMLEAHQSQAAESHLYGGPVGEAVNAQFPLSMQASGLGYRTAEPLPP